MQARNPDQSLQHEFDNAKGFVASSLHGQCSNIWDTLDQASDHPIKLKHVMGLIADDLGTLSTTPYVDLEDGEQFRVAKAALVKATWSDGGFVKMLAGRENMDDMDAIRIVRICKIASSGAALYIAYANGGGGGAGCIGGTCVFKRTFSNCYNARNGRVRLTLRSSVAVRRACGPVCGCGKNQS